MVEDTHKDDTIGGYNTHKKNLRSFMFNLSSIVAATSFLYILFYNCNLPFGTIAFGSSKLGASCLVVGEQSHFWV